MHCGDDDDDGDHAGLENERMGDHVRWSSIDKSITAAATEVGNYWQVNKFVWRLTKNARAYRRKMILFIDDDNVDGGGAASRSVSFIGMRWGSLGSLHALWRPFLMNDLWPTADELLRFVSRVGCVLIVAQVVMLLANRVQGSNRSTSNVQGHSK